MPCWRADFHLCLDTWQCDKPAAYLSNCLVSEQWDGWRGIRYETWGIGQWHSALNIPLALFLWFRSSRAVLSNCQHYFSTLLVFSQSILHMYFIWETVPRREYLVLFIKLSVDFPGLRCHSLMVVTRLGISSRFLDLIRFNWKYFLCLTAGLHLCELLSRNCCPLGRCHNPTHKLWQHCHL